MFKTYLRSIDLVTMQQDIEYTRGIHESYIRNLYPFDFFPYKGLRTVSFSPVTFLYGANGSGKTTLLNVIAEKLGLERHSVFNDSPLFHDYVSKCRVDKGIIPKGSQILTSDDVFDYMINARNLNDGIQARREEIVQKYYDLKYARYQLKSMDDLDSLRLSQEAKTKTQSQFVRSRLMETPVIKSNGESALAFFMEHIKEDALYLLDEPENSLSVSLQQELTDYLITSARYCNCQFIIASHSPILLSMPDALIYDLDDDPVHTKLWTQLGNVRKFFAFFEKHRFDFLQDESI